MLSGERNRFTSQKQLQSAKIGHFHKSQLIFSPVSYLRVQFWYGNYLELQWFGVKLIGIYFLVIHHCAVWVLTSYPPATFCLKHVLPTYFLRLWVVGVFFPFWFCWPGFWFVYFHLFGIILAPNLDEGSLNFPALHLWVGFSCVWNLPLGLVVLLKGIGVWMIIWALWLTFEQKTNLLEDGDWFSG